MERKGLESNPGGERASGADQSLETIVVTRTRDLVGGFKVRRALPSAKRRMVGPFIFLDQMGPEVLRADAGLDVAPHPHIGLATVTYLFDGELLHRDSLGMVQPIRPGEVNWMTAGRGIAHSERTPQEMRQGGSKLFGIQSWVALPQRYEETDPAFAHHGSDELPILEGEGKRVRLIAGSLYGANSPVRTLSEMFYADASLEGGAVISIPTEHEERAAYVVEGSVDLTPGGETFGEGQLLIFKPGAPASFRSAGSSPARVMLLGGAPMDGPAISGGTSSPVRQTESNRRRKTGRLADLLRCRVRRISYRCRSRGLSSSGIHRRGPGTSDC